jgi:hypothetical protein
MKIEDLRGTKRIRTAVLGFADLCLAARPWYHNWLAKITIIYAIPMWNEVKYFSKELFLLFHDSCRTAILALFCPDSLLQQHFAHHLL